MLRNTKFHQKLLVSLHPRPYDGHTHGYFWFICLFTIKYNFLQIAQPNIELKSSCRLQHSFSIVTTYYTL